MSERTRFLITGGLGFIGQSVVSNLLQRGIPSVVADQSADAEAVSSLQKIASRSGAMLDFVTIDVSDFRDCMGVFHRSPGITHTIPLAYVMAPLVDENTSLS